ncbi:MAG: tRNA (adenosine(37)-N6)-dimethylallyltransferase MiaA [Sphingobacterium sp.]|nr:tRNA dimethylallyltransferase [Sphingobacterium sp. JB170]
MDKNYLVITKSQNRTCHNNQVEGKLLPDCLYTILGPTASGKTNLAVALAQVISGEIISVDSRQIYRGMDIGTGKDLNEYGQTPYHLIDIINPGERYDVSRFHHDFNNAYNDITTRGSTPIVAGGTGLYLHSLFIQRPYIHVAPNPGLRERLLPLNKAALIALLSNYQIPDDFDIDISSHKRLIRGIEILDAVTTGNVPQDIKKAPYKPLIFGINPAVAQRRKNITSRLNQRIENGLIEEVRGLLSIGVTHQDLQYYGLEYKYVSRYLLGELTYQNFFTKLETEIHRYAKRQMTFFRKMERDGLTIHWLKGLTNEQRLAEILCKLKKE